MKIKHDQAVTFRLSRHVVRAAKAVLRYDETLTSFVSAALVDAIAARRPKGVALDALRQAVGLPPIFCVRELTEDEQLAHPAKTLANGDQLQPYCNYGVITYRKVRA